MHLSALPGSSTPVSVPQMYAFGGNIVALKIHFCFRARSASSVEPQAQVLS